MIAGAVVCLVAWVIVLKWLVPKAIRFVLTDRRGMSEADARVKLYSTAHTRRVGGTRSGDRRAA